MFRSFPNPKRIILCFSIALFLSQARHLRAESLPACPQGFPEGPVVAAHLDQADIDAGALSFSEIFDTGETLFTANFNVCDGQGRPAATGTGEKREPLQPGFTRVSSPDANSCAGCHNQPRVGGGGDFVANVFVLGQAADPVLNSIEAEFSNNRNTLGMFGSGAIEMLAREMTGQLLTIREEAIAQARTSSQDVTVSLNAKGVTFGELTAHADGTVDTGSVEGVDPDLIIKPFHQAGVVVSLREFTDNAMNHHHGMQAEERFDLNPEKGVDFDQDGIANELTIGDITALAVFQAALGIPGRLMPADPAMQDAVGEGEDLFSQIGCSECHIPEMRLDSRFFSEPNPYNPPGTWSDTTRSHVFDMTTTGQGPYLERDGEGAIVRAFTDLKRHDLCDDAGRTDALRYFCNEQLSQNRPDQDGRPGAEYFITRKLWDVGNSAPYGHVGDLTTITEAILMHGGEGRESRDAFVALTQDEQSHVISFLKTLQVLPEGSDRVAVEGQETEAVASGLQENVALPLIGVLVAASMFAAGMVIGRRYFPHARR